MQKIGPPITIVKDSLSSKWSNKWQKVQKKVWYVVSRNCAWKSTFFVNRGASKMFYNAIGLTDWVDYLRLNSWLVVEKKYCGRLSPVKKGSIPTVQKFLIPHLFVLFEYWWSTWGMLSVMVSHALSLVFWQSLNKVWVLLALSLADKLKYVYVDTTQKENHMCVFPVLSLKKILMCWFENRKN